MSEKHLSSTGTHFSLRAVDLFPTVPHTGTISQVVCQYLPKQPI